MNYRLIEKTLISFRKEEIGLKEAMFVITENCEQELADQKKKIGQDLLKIADDGEIEELRRVIVNYFHIKK